jgi:SAM-dependent methyltransferase
VAKRTGKTHENLENELTPPPSATARTRSSVGRQARGERSGPIGISGGDFATPTARKRTTTQPRGVPVLSPPVAKNGTPPPVARDGAMPESPFGAPEPGDPRDAGDSASQLAAEAAAVRALDSGPLTPPPVADDPGPTPPPEPAVVAAPPSPTEEAELAAGAAEPEPPVHEPAPHAEEVAASAEAPSAIEAHAPSVEASAPHDGPSPPPFEGAAPPELEGGAPSVGDGSSTEGHAGEGAVAGSLADSLRSLTGDGPDIDVDSAADSFSAQETPWPELSHQGQVMRAPTPVPGAIPTDAMGGDSGGARAGGDGEPAPRRPEPEPGPDAAAREDGDVDGGDELELDDGTDGAEPLEALPAEALADGPSAPSASEAQPPAPPPRPTAAPPPIPAGSPRRKTGEIRAPEVPTAQVVASIVPPIPAGAASLPEALAQRPRRPKRSKPWFEEVFDEDYLRTLPFMSAEQTLREVEFIEASLAVKPGGQVLDVGCGYGRHAIELVQRGLDVTGLDLSLPLLLRAADEAQRRAMSVNFVHADMREMAFEKQFDGVYCMLTSFGYFDEETNLRVAEGIGRALKPGGRFLLDLVNRDYVVSDLPSRVWWEGNGCVVLEEVDFNFHTSRILTHRSIVFEDGRQIEQEISVRAYSLHEIGRLLRQAGFRVIDVSGSLATRGHFFGGTSRNLLILAEKRPEES